MTVPGQDAVIQPMTVPTAHAPHAAQPNSPFNSDDELALSVVTAANGTFAFSPGYGPMYYDGRRWQPDPGGKMRSRLTRLVARARAGNSADSAERRRLASLLTVQSVAKLAELDERIFVPDNQWDANPWELNTPGGVVDLRTGQVRAQEPTDYLTKITSVAPDLVVPPTGWLNFLNQVFGGDVEMISFIQRMLGYMLTGDRREQKLFFAHGAGANGKSTLFDLVRHVLGDYAAVVPSSVLLRSRNAGHPTQVAQMQGIRLAITNELADDARWSEDAVKTLTGETTVATRYVSRDFFQMRLTQKHVVVANERPTLTGGDYAMARRLVLIHFGARFEGSALDKSLPDKLRAEAPAVLAWLIAGAREWYQIGLRIPANVSSATEEYIQENDDVALWVEARCKTNGPERTSASALHSDYATWSALCGKRPVGCKRPAIPFLNLAA